MIKLNIPNMGTLADNHYNKIYSKVEELYNKYSSNPYIILLKDESGELDRDFINLLITKPIKDMRKNSKIDFLFKLSYLAYNAPLEITKYLNLTNPKERYRHEDYREARRHYVNNFLIKQISIGFDIEDYIDRHRNYYNSNEEFKLFINDIEIVANSIGDLMKKIFDYESVIDDNYRHELLYNMGVAVCPYCNRQYITNYMIEEDKKKTTGDLDHFYPKKYFPFLGLSIYNFVPSCQICNSRLKSSHITDIMYPYEEEFEGNAYFYIDLDEDDVDITAMIGESDEFKIDIKVNAEGDLNRKLNSSIELFKLKEIYKTHKDYIQETLAKKKSYEDSQKDELRKMFKNKGISIRDEEFDLVLYGNYTKRKDLHKRPLAKLTRDIVRK